MKITKNQKVQFEDKYGRILPAIILDPNVQCDIDPELNGCVQVSAPTFLPFSKEWNNALIDRDQIIV